jgi:hypothetical protein
MQIAGQVLLDQGEPGAGALNTKRRGRSISR